MADQLTLFSAPATSDMFAAAIREADERISRLLLPEGFVTGALPGTIAPVGGAHAGVSMVWDSECVRAILRARADG